MSANEFLPEHKTLSSLKEAAAKCEGCPLYKKATQTVFGNGPAHAHVMFVGEQPGNSEDLAGKPFIGPAGKLLRQFVKEAGMNIDDIYLTNAVKHFGFQEKGETRLHSKPRIIDIDDCNPWLEAEVSLLKPRLIVALGVSAAYSVLGKKVTISKIRGEVIDSKFGYPAFVTVHPSSLLRIPDEEARQQGRAMFFADMKKIAGLVDSFEKAHGKAS